LCGCTALHCCVQFTKKGKIEVDRVLDEEEVIEAAINADVDDVEVIQSSFNAALLTHFARS
jgi:transcriptional/translational regulatory protein YebC/TACO1